MARQLRFALLWLMLLALPLQGYAAAVGLHCGQQPQDLAHAAGNPGDPGVASEAPPPCHGGASAQHVGTVAKFKCSACAACCLGAALPPPALTIESFASVTLPVFFVPTTAAGFFTDGPDRPPRLSRS